MESKWIVIMIVAWLSIMFGSLAYSEYAKNECKTVAINKGLPVSDIVALCSKVNG